jgi:hypothetical protein
MVAADWLDVPPARAEAADNREGTCMTEPRQPGHANYTFGTSHPRLTGQRYLESYAYAANGNVHNPTPRYLWVLWCDGRVVDRFQRRRDLQTAVAQYGDDYTK